MMAHQLDEAYYKLLHDLQSVDFVLVELNLYLDTHPDDEAAIAQYNQFCELRHRIAAQYEAQYGPLMNFGHSLSKAPFQWKEAPWPWQV